MPIEVEIDDKVKLSIDEFTSDKGRTYISMRRLYCSKAGGKFFPQKTRAGGYNLIYLSMEEWVAVLPRLKAYLDTLKQYGPTQSPAGGTTKQPAAKQPPARQPAEKPKPKTPVNDSF